MRRATALRFVPRRTIISFNFQPFNADGHAVRHRTCASAHAGV
jgi:hypothetical protein